jgi:hypothetical protein
MKRGAELGIGLANLSDQVRVEDRDGTSLGLMTVAEAQRRAAQKAGELVAILRLDQLTVVRIVDDAAAFQLKALKKRLKGTPQKQPLQLITCAHCGAKSFFQNPHASRTIIRLRVHKQSPDATKGNEILPFDCLRCNQHQFIEIFYEGYEASH